MWQALRRRPQLKLRFRPAPIPRWSPRCRPPAIAWLGPTCGRRSLQSHPTQLAVPIAHAALQCCNGAHVLGAPHVYVESGRFVIQILTGQVDESIAEAIRAFAETHAPLDSLVPLSAENM